MCTVIDSLSSLPQVAHPQATATVVTAPSRTKAQVRMIRFIISFKSSAQLIVQGKLYWMFTYIRYNALYAKRKTYAPEKKMYPKLLSFVLSLAITAIASAADSHEYYTLDLTDGSRLLYALVLPDDFDADKTYPVLLAMPPGPQTYQMVESGLLRFWGKQAAERGWIVVSPVAPEGVLFFRGSEVHIPVLLDHIQSKYKIEHDKFHIAGASNGGRSSFRVAGLYPERFLSITVLPGYPPTEEDVKHLSKLKSLPIHMFAGGDDVRWVKKMNETKEA